MGKDKKDDNIKSFALDRLTNLEITKTSFVIPDNYNVEESFRYSFGIISPINENPQEIILSFDPIQGKYIKSLPLHESQQTLVDNEKELQVQLKLCVTYDLVMEILSYGKFVKVLQPSSLVKKVIKAHKKAYKQYK